MGNGLGKRSKRGDDDDDVHGDLSADEIFGDALNDSECKQLDKFKEYVAAFHDEKHENLATMRVEFVVVAGQLRKIAMHQGLDTPEFKDKLAQCQTVFCNEQITIDPSPKGTKLKEFLCNLNESKLGDLDLELLNEVRQNVKHDIIDKYVPGFNSWRRNNRQQQKR